MTNVTSIGLREFAYNKQSAADDFDIWTAQFRSYVATLELKFDKPEDQDSIKHMLIHSIGQHGIRTMRAIGMDWETKPYKDLMTALETRYMKKSETSDMMNFANIRMMDGEELEDYIWQVFF